MPPESDPGHSPTEFVAFATFSGRPITTVNVGKEMSEPPPATALRPLATAPTPTNSAASPGVKASPEGRPSLTLPAPLHGPCCRAWRPNGQTPDREFPA